MELVMAAIGCSFLGWVAGMFTFKRSNRWCPTCGGHLRCEDCKNTARQPVSQ